MRCPGVFGRRGMHRRRSGRAKASARADGRRPQRPARRFGHRGPAEAAERRGAVGRTMAARAVARRSRCRMIAKLDDTARRDRRGGRKGAAKRAQIAARVTRRRRLGEQVPTRHAKTQVALVTAPAERARHAVFGGRRLRPSGELDVGRRRTRCRGHWRRVFARGNEVFVRSRGDPLWRRRRR